MGMEQSSPPKSNGQLQTAAVPLNTHLPAFWHGGSQIGVSHVSPPNGGSHTQWPVQESATHWPFPLHDDGPQSSANSHRGPENPTRQRHWTSVVLFRSQMPPLMQLQPHLVPLSIEVVTGGEHSQTSEVVLQAPNSPHAHVSQVAPVKIPGHVHWLSDGRLQKPPLRQREPSQMTHPGPNRGGMQSVQFGNPANGGAHTQTLMLSITTHSWFVPHTGVHNGSAQKLSGLVKPSKQMHVPPLWKPLGAHPSTVQVSPRRGYGQSHSNVVGSQTPSFAHAHSLQVAPPHAGGQMHDVVSHTPPLTHMHAVQFAVNGKRHVSHDVPLNGARHDWHSGPVNGNGQVQFGLPIVHVPPLRHAQPVHAVTSILIVPMTRRELLSCWNGAMHPEQLAFAGATQHGPGKRQLHGT